MLSIHVSRTNPRVVEITNLLKDLTAAGLEARIEGEAGNASLVLSPDFRLPPSIVRTEETDSASDDSSDAEYSEMEDDDDEVPRRTPLLPLDANTLNRVLNKCTKSRSPLVTRLIGLCWFAIKKL